MGSVYQVGSNGNAPSGLSSGDYVNTAGGVYQVVAPGTIGSTYNPSSGYWSIKHGADNPGNYLNEINKMSATSSAVSQTFAREQMKWQEEQNAKAMAYNSAEAQKLRDWQENLSNTAHQREVKDLIAAGLNPILSTNSSGATTPSGASASGVTSSGAMGTASDPSSSYASMLSGYVSAATSLATKKLDFEIEKYAQEMATGRLNSQLAVQQQVALLNAKNALEVAGINASATISSSLNSASAVKYSSDVSASTQKYLAANYPSTQYGAASAAANKISNFMKTNSTAKSVINSMKQFWIDYFSNIKNSVKR